MTDVSALRNFPFNIVYCDQTDRFSWQICRVVNFFYDDRPDLVIFLEIQVQDLDRKIGRFR